MINCVFIFLLLGILSLPMQASTIPSSPRSEQAIARVEPSLRHQLLQKSLHYGAPVFIRIFKQSSELELCLESESGEYQHFKTYEICHFSGDLGPKLKEGDRQSPEGFYFVNAGRLNPWSRFHLSFNLGYPNQYDRYHQRTGSALMVHGNCVSIGCYAMTDPLMEEIYALVNAALHQGQAVFRVHAFPFRLDTTTLDKYRQHRWFSFWQNLKEGYDHFEQYRRPPNTEVKAGRYIFKRL